MLSVSQEFVIRKDEWKSQLACVRIELEYLLIIFSGLLKEKRVVVDFYFLFIFYKNQVNGLDQ
jgi:hypothetical protein